MARLISASSEEPDLDPSHRVITVIEEQRLVVLDCTALFSKVGQQHKKSFQTERVGHTVE